MPGRKGFLTWVGRAACPLRIRAVRLASDAADTTVGIMGSLCLQCRRKVLDLGDQAK